VAVRHAIDYAHSRGVLHRDLKPDNVMLGPHGETLVVDWGLAKAIGGPDTAPETGPGPLRPLSGTDGSGTMAGSVIGTPSYMSPEQAAGEVQSLGPTSDIFSLGSTLFDLLTGHAPFRGKGLSDLIADVTKAEFPPPRAVNKGVPPALEAVCLKAMALRPADRYPTAGALAADLDRWLADEPVSAYREPFAVRAARWARRHRTAVAVGLALLLTGSAALGVSNVLIGRERARTERNFHRARTAVEQMLTKVGEVDLADVPQMEPVRRDLLARLKDRGAEDEAAYRLAIGEQEAQVARPASGAEARRELARYLNNLAILQSRADAGAAAATFRRAVRIQDELEAVSSANAGFRWQRARTRNNLAALLFRAGLGFDEAGRLFDEAGRLFDAARAGFEALAVDFPSVPDYRRERAIALTNLGMLCGARPAGGPTPVDLYRLALVDLRRLVGEFAEVPDHRLKLGLACLNLGIILRPDRPEEADRSLVEAVSTTGQLVAEYPQVPEYQAALGRALTERAVLMAGLGRGPEELDLLDAAIQSLTRAVKGNLREATYAQFLVEAHNHRIEQFLKLGRHAEMAAEARKLAEVSPGRPDGHLYAATCLARCVELAGTASGEVAETYARDAVAALRRAFERGLRGEGHLDKPAFAPIRERPDFRKLREDIKNGIRRAVV
jgi:tetratricopeptide (TPR) repeat protein